jgi:hypothetical protein
MNASQNNEKLASHVNNWSLIRLLHRPAQNFVRQWCNVSLPGQEELRKEEQRA